MNRLVRFAVGCYVAALGFIVMGIFLGMDYVPSWPIVIGVFAFSLLLTQLVKRNAY